MSGRSDIASAVCIRQPNVVHVMHLTACRKRISSSLAKARCNVVIDMLLLVCAFSMISTRSMTSSSDFVMKSMTAKIVRSGSQRADKNVSLSSSIGVGRASCRQRFLKRIKNWGTVSWGS